MRLYHRLPEFARRPEVPIVFVAWMLLRWLGWVAPVHPLGILVVLVVAGVLSDLSVRIWSPERTGFALWARMGVLVGAITLVMYTTGWGPELAIGYAFAIGENIRFVGSRGVKPALVWSIVGLVAGSVAIGLGVAPTMVPAPEVYGLSALALLGVFVVARVVYESQLGKEQAEADLRSEEERFETLIEHGTDVIIVFDMERNPPATYVSPSFQRVFGLHPGAAFALGRDFIHPDDLDEATVFFGRALEESRETIWTELRLRDAIGDWHWFEVSLTNRLDDPPVAGIVANMRDVTERKLFEEQLSYQAYHDQLTRLPNRGAFLERLQDALAVERGHDQHLAVLFLDVDRFKLVNDSLGHEVGDRLLVEVSDRLRAMVRPSDVVARFGGDEFTIMLTRMHSAEDAVTVAERMLDAMRTPVVVGGRELLVSASIGIAVAPIEAGVEDAGDLLREADLAMYLAKEKGRARWEVFDARSAPQVVQRLELEAELWQAVEENELVVHFQPEYSMDGSDVVALEALVRWDHPERGLLLPGAFIPYAEESSLILAIDRYVLRAACRQARVWEQLTKRLVTVSVNLSPRFVRQTEAVDDVMSVVRETGVDPHALQLEITERSALEDEERTVQTLRALRERGIRVAIDDFGTGYSSLSYLKRFPVDVLKLDKTFVDELANEDTDAAIVEAVITMGHALGMRITAEGVERPEQVAQLRSLGCDAAQGFHFARRLAPHAIEDVLLGGLGNVVPLRRHGTAG